MSLQVIGLLMVDQALPRKDGQPLIHNPIILNHKSFLLQALASIDKREPQTPEEVEDARP